MAKARSLVGLDVHATKIVAAVLDAESGQLQSFVMGGESDAAAAGSPVRCGAPMRPGRLGTGLRASSRGGALSVSLRRRARSRGRRGTG